MPPVRKDGAQVGTEHRPDASNATTTVSITPRSVKGRRRRAARRREAMTARVSLLVPDEHRTWWHYLVRCPACGRPHLGRSRELADVTGTRRLPCRRQDLRPQRFGSGSVTPAQWRLARQIEAILAAESGVSVEELAERTGGAFADVRTVAWALYRMRRADFCWSFLTAVPSVGEGRRAA